MSWTLSSTQQGGITWAAVTLDGSTAGYLATVALEGGTVGDLDTAVISILSMRGTCSCIAGPIQGVVCGSVHRPSTQPLAALDDT